MLRQWTARAAGVLATAFASSAALANQYNLQPPQTEIARQIYALHADIMWIIVGIFVVVFGTMTYAIIKHRKSAGHKAELFHENTTVEIVWTIIPFLILIGIAYPATKTVIAMKDTSAPDLTIKATGYQWKWGYDYLKGEGDLKDVADGVSFFSTLSTPLAQRENREPKGEHYLLEVDNPVVVPVGKRVRILLTAGDVIHAWWVPALGVKQDAIPGFIRDSWFKIDKEGTYRGQCAELCGKEHGFMPIVVNAVSPEKFASWAAEQKKQIAAAADDPNKTYTLDELRARGEKVYAQHCVACHQPNGQGVPNTFPALDGSAIVKGPKAAHMDMVMNGSKKNPAMVAFSKQLNDVEIAAVIAFERNAWSNKVADVAQPAEIKAARK
ncbi:MAG TPA: cytochrome c oxidase subunit II [Burkholderiales bacterium]|nr:cytochrome c oxidase subunit II [Burkholderiales bacterium]